MKLATSTVHRIKVKSLARDKQREWLYLQYNSTFNGANPKNG